MKPLLAAFGAAASRPVDPGAPFCPTPPPTALAGRSSLWRDGPSCAFAGFDGASARHPGFVCGRSGARLALSETEGSTAEADAGGCNEGVVNSHRRVAVLLPEPDDASDDNIGDDARWHAEAIGRLGELSARFGLPVLDDGLDDNGDDAQAGMRQYSHYLTAVPHPRAKSYALAIRRAEPSPPSGGRSRRRNGGTKRTKPKLHPIVVDLCPGPEGRLGHRLGKTLGGEGGGELLLKALGLKKMRVDRSNGGGGGPLVVYDLTAGLARDSLVIASSFLPDVDAEGTAEGDVPLRLHMAERDPIVAALLSDAARRLDLLAESTTPADAASSNERDIAKRLQRCLSMEEGEGVSVLDRLKSKRTASDADADTTPYPPDVVYLDPMFPPRKKRSASVKKDMAMLHSLLGTAEATTSNNTQEAGATRSIPEGEDGRAKEERGLLLAALGAATRRVVVKRPIAALPLGWSTADDDVPKPSYDVRGSVNRFDVYVIS